MNSTPEWHSTNSIKDDLEKQFSRTSKRLRRQRIFTLIIGVLLVAVGLVAIAIGNGAQSDAVSQTTINKYIRAHGGIPPCKHEDGSGQPGNCYWDASERGNGKGYDYIAVSQGPNKDKAIVYLTGPKAKKF